MHRVWHNDERTATLHHGDARYLDRIPDGHVDCIVTSPPYWGLRDYGLLASVWGGDADCTHVWGAWSESHDEREAVSSGKSRTTDRYYGDESRRFDGNHQKHAAGAFCARCGAWFGNLGLEPTPELYVEHMVMVFRELWRVLKPTGTVWLNLGDSYAGSGYGGWEHGEIRRGRDRVGVDHSHGKDKRTPPGLKPKDLVGIPWRVAFALQADGWWLRSDIIWSKPNPMPESVQDRPTRAHEYLFLLTKSERYYYDSEAVKETGVSGASDRKKMTEKRDRIGGRCKDSVDPLMAVSSLTHIGQVRSVGLPRTRNRRSVWEIATQPYPDAHFATYPEALVKPCILAGSPMGGVVLDPFCGAGTTVAVANQLGRKAIGVDASMDYLELASKYVATGKRGRWKMSG